MRLSKYKQVFDKGYRGNWTEEIFIVDVVKMAAVPQIMYKLKDWKGEPVVGSFYDTEIQLVSKGLDDFWKVEKILRTRKVGKKTQYYVKWEGHPDSLNSWVNEEDVKRIGDNESGLSGEDETEA